MVSIYLQKLSIYVLYVDSSSNHMLKKIRSINLHTHTWLFECHFCIRIHPLKRAKNKVNMHLKKKKIMQEVSHTVCRPPHPSPWLLLIQKDKKGHKVFDTCCVKRPLPVLSDKGQRVNCVQNKVRILTDPLRASSSSACPRHLRGRDFSRWIRCSSLTEKVPSSKL